MKTVHLEPLSPKGFIKQFFTAHGGSEDSYFAYFKPTIEQLSKTAIGPYSWFIPENHTGRILYISDDCHTLTPFTAEQWLNLENPNDQLPNIMYPRDISFIYASIGYGIENAAHYFKQGCKVNLSVYARFEDSQRVFRWRLMQITDFYFDELEACQSVLVVMTDISHLPTPTEPIAMMLVIGPLLEQTFRVLLLKKQLNALKQISITKRELQILQLMANGLKTPQIVERLGIAYDTVENHKRNLRTKTNTKTAAELISYAMHHCLLS